MKLTRTQEGALRAVSNKQIYQWHLKYKKELYFLNKHGLITLSYDNIRTIIDKPIYVLTSKGREFMD